MKRVTILGATGSIGLRTLDLVASFPEELRVAGLAARGSNVERVADLCRKYAPAAVALLDPRAVDTLARLLSAPRPELLAGPEGLDGEVGPRRKPGMALLVVPISRASKTRSALAVEELWTSAAMTLVPSRRSAPLPKGIMYSAPG